MTGTIALFDTDSGRLTCSDAERCRKPHLPASTFKIPNTIIALENGIVTDAETVLPWDGKEYAVRDWNQDLTLRAAIRVSCVPCFQELARRIGEERMREWVARLDFGNRDTAGGIDRFWLTGALRITAVEELDFLSRLDQGKLPIQSFTRDAVIDMLTVDVGDDYVLRGKTGLLGPPDNPERIGWFVGWVEKGNRRVYFATLLDGHGAEIDLARARRRVTERVLARLGVLGS